MCCIISDGELRESLQKEIEGLHLEHHVFLLGFIPSAATLISGFDIFILPSLKEGLPYTLLEAGLAERATIATRVGGIPEILTNGLSGVLIPPQNVSEIARACVFLLEDPKRRSDLGSALRQRVHEQFSLQEMLTRTQSLYE